jgi:hypothetical protein
MRVQKRSPWLNSLGVVLTAMALWGTQANAAVTSDQPGSVVIWPKVIADGTRDTLISLTNTRNDTAYAHCEYVNGISTCAVTGTFCSVPNAAPGSPGACEDIAGNVCVQQWREADFDVILTRQQPTIWRVSTGRVDNPFLPADGACDPIAAIPPNIPERQSCPGLFLVGMVPPAVQPFRGQLTCIQVALDGGQIGSNGLKGEATIETVGSTQISTYNSINVQAVGDVAAVDGLIELNGEAYSACPAAVEVSHYASGAQDLVAADFVPPVCDPMEGCPVDTEITLVPCRADFTSLTGARWATFIQYTNEFESTNSISQPLECWANFDLRDLGFPDASSSGTTFQRTRITPTGDGRCILGNINAVCDDDADCGTGGVCGPVTGILAVVEEFHNTAASLTDPPTSPAGTAASNGYSVAFDGSLEKAGACRNDLDTSCTEDADCPSGLCRFSGTACQADANCPVNDFCDRCMNDEIKFEPGAIAEPTPFQ